MANKVEWITKLPKVLCIQLNRLKYEGGQVTKVLDPLDLEKVIHMDRYEFKNRQVSERIRQNVQAIREKLKILQKSMTEYTSFNGSDQNIHTIL